MLAGQAIPLGRELDENRRLIILHQLRIALLKLLGEELLPAFLELVGILIKPVDGFADQLRATNSEELLGCGIGLATDRLVIKDQNGIQRILKDRLELTLARVQGACDLPLFFLRPKQELGEQQHDGGEGRQLRRRVFPC